MNTLFAAVTLLAADSPIPGWMLAGEAPKNFEIGLDRRVAHGGRASAYLKATVTPTGFGTLMQNARPATFWGKRVRFSAWLKTDSAQRASLWMRVDGPHGRHTAFDNMDQRAISGTTDWTRYAIVLDVAENATNIGFGVINEGGNVWVDDIKMEIVDQSVPTTDMMTKVDPKNLDFED